MVIFNTWKNEIQYTNLIVGEQAIGFPQVLASLSLAMKLDSNQDDHPWI